MPWIECDMFELDVVVIYFAGLPLFCLHIGGRRYSCNSRLILASNRRLQCSLTNYCPAMLALIYAEGVHRSGDTKLVALIAQHEKPLCATNLQSLFYKRSEALVEKSPNWER